MQDYLIDTGEFNVIVRPHVKRFYILGDDARSREVQRMFLEDVDVSYEGLEHSWFRYQQDESWETFDKRSFALQENFAELDLIDQFVLKKFNFGGIVAIRDGDTKKTKVFKRSKLDRQ